jgi:hypothetical protein
MGKAEVDAYNTRFLSLLASRSWMQVRVVLEGDPCLHCQAQPTSIEREDLPALPHRRCQRQGGCACWYAATLEQVEVQS